MIGQLRRLVIRGLGVSIRRRPVLVDVDASLVVPGFVALVGPSGSGKTTLLGAIGGALRHGGSVDAEEVGGRCRRVVPDDVSWAMQHSRTSARRTVWHVVGEERLLRGHPHAVTRTGAAEALTALGLGDRLDARFGDLSGGERQRVVVARALSTDRALLLADEPTSSLDSPSSELVVDEMRRQAEGGRLVVVATHDPLVAERADVVLTLRGGRLAPS